MSRVGKQPITIPSGVEASVAGGIVKVKGPKGQLEQDVDPDFAIGIADGQITVERPSDQKQHRAFHGLYRALVQNMVTGVSEGFTKNLEITGVGYRAAVQGQSLSLQLGYSHDIDYPIPEGITIKCEKPTSIAISGADKQRVGQVAAEIRAYRKPEPYKGKGIRYSDETILRKEGKKK